MVTLKLKDVSKSDYWGGGVYATNKRKLDVAVFGVAHQSIMNDTFHFATKYNFKKNFANKGKRKNSHEEKYNIFLVNVIDIKPI